MKPGTDVPGYTGWCAVRLPASRHLQGMLAQSPRPSVDQPGLISLGWSAWVDPPGWVKVGHCERYCSRAMPRRL